jgi:hypothetical protein
MGMNLKLSFRADPPVPFHTLDYHLKYALINKYFEPCIDTNTKQQIIYNAADALIKLFDIPDNYKIHSKEQAEYLSDLIGQF